MSEVMDALWKQAEPKVYISRSEYEASFDGWDIEPLYVGGRLAFAALTKGPEFHYASFETGARITRNMIWSRLDRIREEHGYVTTRTPIEGYDSQHRINRMLGFRETERDEFTVHYRMDRPCPR